MLRGELKLSDALSWRARDHEQLIEACLLVNRIIPAKQRFCSKVMLSCMLISCHSRDALFADTVRVVDGLFECL